jgi:hypothetical protein
MPLTDSEASDTAIAQYDTAHMRAIAADLAAAGLITHLTDGRTGLDLTAAINPARLRGAEFWMDEDGHADLRFWYPPGTPPAQVTATALRALQAITEPGTGTSAHAGRT